MDTDETATLKTYVVTKAINTTSRRLKLGDLILETDDVSPYSMPDLVSRKFLVGAKTKTAERVAAKADDAPDSAEKPKTT